MFRKILDSFLVGLFCMPFPIIKKGKSHKITTLNEKLVCFLFKEPVVVFSSGSDLGA
jgi:hypothetical protein